MGMKILAAGVRRSFAVTIGTKPGYNALALPYTVEMVRDVVLDWLSDRMQRGLPILSGVLSQGHVLYAWPLGRGTEPVCVYAGEVSVVHCRDVGDTEVIGMLNELGGRLAEELGQTRVYVSYRDEAWVLEREGGEPSPGGPPPSA